MAPATTESWNRSKDETSWTNCHQFTDGTMRCKAKATWVMHGTVSNPAQTSETRLAWDHWNALKKWPKYQTTIEGDQREDERTLMLKLHAHKQGWTGEGTDLGCTWHDSATGGLSLQNAFKGHSLSSEPSEISKPITASNVYLMTWRTKCACNCMSRCESEFTDCDTCIHHHLHLIPIASTARIAYWSGPRLLSWSPRRSHRSRYTVLS